MISPCDKCQFLFNEKRKPFSMNCKHHFCNKCILKQHNSIDMSNSQATTKPVNCPICKQPSIPFHNTEYYDKILSNNRYKGVDRIIKISCFGEMSVGKTSLIYRLAKDIFSKDVMPTIGGGFQFVKKIVQQNTIQYNFIDTAGSQKYRTVFPAQFKQADIAFIVFDITKSIEENRLKQWVCEIEQKCITTEIFLIANKSDLIDDLEKSESMAYALQVQNEKKWKCYLISCLKGSGIQELFKQLNRIAIQQELKRKSQSIILQPKGKKQIQSNNSRCC